MRSCVLCKECDNPISYPHTTTIEGILYSENNVCFEVYHDGIFIGWFNTKEAAQKEYGGLTCNKK
jgi:hypothetical protein